MSRHPRMFRPRLLDERFEDRPYAGVQVEAPREVLLRLGILALDESRDTAVPVGPGVRRIELDRLVKVCDGNWEPDNPPSESVNRCPAPAGSRSALVSACPLWP